jgi:hypothetical protein
VSSRFGPILTFPELLKLDFGDRTGLKLAGSARLSSHNTNTYHRVQVIMETMWDLLMLLVLSALAFVVSGVFLGLSPRLLNPVLITALVLVVVRVLFNLTNGVILLSLLASLVLSARLLVERRAP